MKRALICLMALVPVLFFALTARQDGPAADSQSPKPRASAMSDRPSVQIQRRGNRYISVREGRDLDAHYVRNSGEEFALESNDAQPISLCAGDFNEDGVPDLVSYYSSSSGGFLSLHSGHVDSIFPNSPEAMRRRQEGTFTDAPFLLPARVFETKEAADFLGAGDFNADGHLDLVLASRGGSSLRFFSGDGSGSLAESEKISLPGAVTALACGQINRLDGLVDIIVAVRSSEGARALIFESMKGASLAQPLTVDLPAAATAIITTDVEGDSAIDIALACGNELLVVKGRSELADESRNDHSEITHRSFSVPIRSFAIGDFFDDNRPDIALLGDDGAIRMLSAPKNKKQNSESVTKWQIKKLAGESFPQAASIQCARLTSHPGESLVVLDPASGKIHVIDSFKQSKSKLRIDSSSMVDLVVETEPVAALGMRLTPDALDDLVILRKGHLAPSLVETAAAMIFTVTNANDMGGGSLRQAIMDANANAGLDTISFMVGSGGPVSINPSSQLPAINEAVMIDGESQPLFAGSPIVELFGMGVTGSALTITGGNTVVRGFVINRFIAGPGIFINTNGGNVLENNFIGTDTSGTMAAPNLSGIEVGDTPGNTIGGTAANSRNLISGNIEGGILIVGPLATGNQVMGNLIGVEVNCSAAVPNGTAGVSIVAGASNNTVGGTTSAARNMVSGNNGSGILLMDSATTGNLVQGNEIGIGLFMMTIPNTQQGVSISGGASNTIGGAVSGARNVISGNGENGVRIDMGTATGNSVQGNFIGTDPTGTTAVPNGQSGIRLEDMATNNQIGGNAGNLISGNAGSGVSLGNASNNQVQGNLIGTQIDGLSALGNGGDGVVMGTASSNNLIGGTTAGAGNTIANNSQAVRIFSGTGNSILSNSIFDNQFGIDFIDDAGPTPNDPGDADTGPNDIQNFPVITSAATNATLTVIQGTLNSTANTTFRVEFFSSPMCDPSGFGQGKRFLGSTMVTTDGGGNANINAGLPVTINVSDLVTATATNPSGNTSEFSNCAMVTPIVCAINCPADQTVSTGPNEAACGTRVTYPDPQIIGMCGTVNCAPASGSFFPVGSTQVTCTTGFGPSCSFNVFVLDRTRPNITCPGNVTANAPAGQSSAVVNYPAPTATDNCPAVTVSCSPPSGSVFPRGTSTVDCVARDESINETPCFFTVTVNDSDAPTIRCPANIVTQAPSGQNSAVVNYPPPVVTDNLPGATASCVPASGSSFPLGTTTVTCTATDTSGNRAMCGFTITVNGGTPTARVTIDGGKDAVEFGTQTPVTPRRKPPKTESPCSFFNIENTGLTPLVLTYVSAVRTGNAVTSGRITDANERGTYTLSTVNVEQGEEEVPAGTTITVGVRQTVRFCLRFDPLIPAVQTNTNNLTAPSVIPDLITSRCNFTIQGGAALSVNVVGNVAETLMLINPDNPRKQSVVTFARSGNEFILIYSIFDPDLDTNRARYELLNSSGQIVGQPIEVDLAQAISQTGLLSGQSFTVEQRFTGANSHPEITGCRLTVTDGEGSVSKTATSSSSSASVRRRGRLTLAPPVMKIGNR